MSFTSGYSVKGSAAVGSYRDGGIGYGANSSLGREHALAAYSVRPPLAAAKPSRNIWSRVQNMLDPFHVIIGEASVAERQSFELTSETRTPFVNPMLLSRAGPLMPLGSVVPEDVRTVPEQVEAPVNDASGGLSAEAQRNDDSASTTS